MTSFEGSGGATAPPVPTPAPVGTAPAVTAPPPQPTTPVTNGSAAAGPATAEAAGPAPTPTPTIVPATAPAPTPPSPAAERNQYLRSAGVSLLLLSVFLIGFALYLFGLSAIVESRSQASMYSQLRNELGQATAPTGPTTSGAPVAVLDFPTIGIKNLVVVEGTTPENLMHGPGLVPNSPLPGQGGTSEIYGRLATFGAPFSHLGQLAVGAEIKAVTSQGVAIYKVAAFGDSSHEVIDPAPNKLILLTAGSPYIPTYYSYLDADLVSSVQPQSGIVAPIFTDETPLAGDNDALVITLLWALALAGVSAVSTYAAVKWAPWPAYLTAAPIVIVVVWNLYQNLAAVLPNVY
jgi:sortase A